MAPATRFPVEMNADGAFRAEVIGKPTTNGMIPVQCYDETAYIPIGQIPSTWCCGRVVMNDEISSCVGGKVVPLSSVTTTRPPPPPVAVNRQISNSNGFKPELVTGIDKEGRQLIKCLSRMYSVIASRVNFFNYLLYIN